MDKSNKKISNIVRSFFFFGTFVGVATAVQANPEGESEINAENESPINRRERGVQRAKKIVNLALFDAINQGSLPGVRFLVESGADPIGENSHGRTPLDLAEYLARKHSEAEERQEIADFLRDWIPEEHPVDDAVIVATAREVSGLNGGGKLKAAKAALEAIKKSTSGAVKGSASGAISGAATGACAASAKSSVMNTGKDALKEAAEGALMGLVSGGVAGAVTGGIIGSLDGVFHFSEKVVNGIASCAGAAAGGAAEGLVEKSKASSGDKIIITNIIVPPKQKEETKKPSGEKKTQAMERYYCDSCGFFYASRSTETRKDLKYWNRCTKCGCLSVWKP
ncbi:MAG: ankyrin repeat domain-containing protein [Puniceicoccales bacterium]|jgi:hypothetical protein|nr:ankyrin repeat domain-containing protein [Puniceicoccales bacterium]